jgi:hypothetical protein
LMIENAKVFNPVDTIYYREACRMKWIGEKLISRIEDGTLHKGDIELATCSVCEKDNEPNKLLLCDACDNAFHTFCLEPPLKRVPTGIELTFLPNITLGDWYCGNCDPRKYCTVCKQWDEGKGVTCTGCELKCHYSCMPSSGKKPKYWYCNECRVPNLFYTFSK